MGHDVLSLRHIRLDVPPSVPESGRETISHDEANFWTGALHARITVLGLQPKRRGSDGNILRFYPRWMLRKPDHHPVCSMVSA